MALVAEGRELLDDLDQVRPGIWAKAFAEVDGDDAKAKARYIRLRVQADRDEAGEGHRDQEDGRTSSKGPRRPSADGASTLSERNAVSPADDARAASSMVVAPGTILFARLGLVFMLFSLLKPLFAQIDIRQSLGADVAVAVIRVLLIGLVVGVLPRVGIPAARWARKWYVAWASWAGLVLVVIVGAFVFAVVAVGNSPAFVAGLEGGFRELVEVVAMWGLATALSRQPPPATRPGC